MRTIKPIETKSTMDSVKCILNGAFLVMMGFVFAFLVMFVYSIVQRWDALSTAFRYPQQVSQLEFAESVEVTKK